MIFALLRRLVPHIHGEEALQLPLRDAEPQWLRVWADGAKQCGARQCVRSGSRDAVQAAAYLELVGRVRTPLLVAKLDELEQVLQTYFALRVLVQLVDRTDVRKVYWDAGRRRESARALAV
jgi:hypothetical protein